MGCKLVLDDVVVVEPKTIKSTSTSTQQNQDENTADAAISQDANERGYITSKWHLEIVNPNGNDEGMLLPGWSRGCSMYVIEPKTGLIEYAIDITESPAKINEKQLNRLLSLIGQQ